MSAPESITVATPATIKLPPEVKGFTMSYRDWNMIRDYVKSLGESKTNAWQSTAFALFGAAVSCFLTLLPAWSTSSQPLRIILVMSGLACIVCGLMALSFDKSMKKRDLEESKHILKFMDSVVVPEESA